ncbi:hypothetical protein NEOLEDRAFT_1137618 [Neolentinus lepideus HHB14362 ss-1]|uniref:DUF6533 domain-containing protein n=1 Tax=Neolentinus lepideus HHB14362 ss-1 TaxID=1314782 RepID=A0A165QMI4_9AGAM|nr:hypothetical protein NEOLEDRAFT_1137618 [Neolentinus lepideus HHB14362 ss-1]
MSGGQELNDIAQGIPGALYLEVASIALVYWEYCITLDQEVQYFWVGHWSLSRALFLLNRYLTIVNAITGVFLMPVIDFATIITTVILTAVEVMHALRLWYMFSHNSYVQCAILALSVAYAATEFAIVGLWLHNEYSQLTNGRLWIPPLIVHSVLYGMTILRAVFFKPVSGDARAVMNRILKDGFLFFSASFGRPLQEELFLVMTSIAMSRLMFSIHSLSASLGTESEWLLSHLEMSRMHFRHGVRDGELIVDVDNVGADDYELTNTSDRQLEWLSSSCTIVDGVVRTPTETLVAQEGVLGVINVSKHDLDLDSP